MKKRFKIPLSAFIAVALVYATVPLWSTVVIRAQLPAGWQLIKADLAYPGLTSVGIRNLQLATSLAGNEWRVSAGPGELFYSGEKIQFTSLSINATPKLSGKAPAPFSLQDLNLPLLVWPGDLPEISIGELNIDLASVAPALQFQNLELGSGGDNSQKVSGNFSVNGLASVRGRILAHLYPGSLEAGIWITGATDNPLLELSLSQTQQGDDADNEISAITQLGETEMPGLVAAIFPDGPNLPEGLSGELTINADFGGRQQSVQNIYISSPALKLQIENETFTAIFAAVAKVEGQNVVLGNTSAGTVQYQGRTNRLTDLWQELMPQYTTRTGASLDSVREAQLDIAADSRLEFEFSHWRQASFSGAVDVAVSMPSVELQSMGFSQLQVHFADLEELEIQQLSGVLEVTAAANTPFSYVLDDTSLHADSMSLHSQGQLSLADGVVHFKTSEPATAQLQNMAVEAASIDGGEALMVVTESFSVEANLSSEDGSVTTSGSGTIYDGRIDSLGINAELVNLQWVDLDFDNRSGLFVVSTEGLILLMDGESYRGVEPHLGCGISTNGDLGCKGLLAFESDLELPVGISGNIDDEHWRVDLLPTEIAATQLPSLLSASNIELPDIIELNEGKVMLRATALADPERHGDFTIDGDAINLSASKSQVNNLGFTLSGTMEDEISANALITLQTLNLAAGLDITNIGARIEITGKNNLAVDSINAEIFSGVLEISSLQFKDGLLQDSLVQMSGIELMEILSFADIDGLAGTGILQLSLPLSSDENGLSIRNGTFNSTVPGTLKYSAVDPVTVSGNIGLQALENFHYDSLDGNFNYTSNGEYRIQVHLAGYNPDLYDGYPIELNLNIGGELPELFDVLFLTGDFEDAILERIRIK